MDKVFNYFYNIDTKLLYVNIWDSNFEKYYLVICICDTKQRAQDHIEKINNGKYILYQNKRLNREFLSKNDIKNLGFFGDVIKL